MRHYYIELIVNYFTFQIISNSFPDLNFANSSILSYVKAFKLQKLEDVSYQNSK